MNVAWLTKRVEQLESQLRSAIYTMVEFTTLARVDANSSKDAANVAGDQNGERQRPIRRVAPWGLSGRPVVGVLSAIVKATAGAFSGINVGIATDKYGPQDLDDGETSLYCKAGGTRVYLDKDGNIFIDAASGKEVTVNGGTQKVARVDDHGDAGTITLILTGTTVLSGTYVDPDGVSTPIISGTPITLKVKNTEGADKVFA